MSAISGAGGPTDQVWQPVHEDEVFLPGQSFRVDTTTGVNEVLSNTAASAAAHAVSGDCVFAGEMSGSGIVLEPADPTPVQTDKAAEQDAPAALRIMKPEQGYLGDCAVAGVPRDLLLVLSPGVTGDKTTGKTPSYYNAGLGKWAPSKGWQNGGILKADLVAGNSQGANAGVLLGVAAGGIKLASADQDTIDQPGAVHLNRLIAEAVRKAFNCPEAAERETFDYRSLFLFSLPVDEKVGSVQDFNILRQVDGQPMPVLVSKIQILGKGQQCVIAGGTTAAIP